MARDYHRMNELAPRELEVLTLMAEGLNARGIAERLNMQYGTVRRYADTIYKKLGATHRTQAVVKAQLLGILAMPGLSSVAVAILQLLRVQPGALDELEDAGLLKRGDNGD